MLEDLKTPQLSPEINLPLINIIDEIILEVLNFIIKLGKLQIKLFFSFYLGLYLIIIKCTRKVGHLGLSFYLMALK